MKMFYFQQVVMCFALDFTSVSTTKPGDITKIVTFHVEASVSAYTGYDV